MSFGLGISFGRICRQQRMLDEAYHTDEVRWRGRGGDFVLYKKTRNIAFYPDEIVLTEPERRIREALLA